MIKSQTAHGLGVGTVAVPLCFPLYNKPGKKRERCRLNGHSVAARLRCKIAEAATFCKTCQTIVLASNAVWTRKNSFKIVFVAQLKVACCSVIV